MVKLVIMAVMWISLFSLVSMSGWSGSSAMRSPDELTVNSKDSEISPSTISTFNSPESL